MHTAIVMQKKWPAPTEQAIWPQRGGINTTNACSPYDLSGPSPFQASHANIESSPERHNSRVAISALVCMTCSWCTIQTLCPVCSFTYWQTTTGWCEGRNGLHLRTESQIWGEQEATTQTRANWFQCIYAKLLIPKDLPTNSASYKKHHCCTRRKATVSRCEPSNKMINIEQSGLGKQANFIRLFISAMPRWQHLLYWGRHALTLHCSEPNKHPLQ